MTETTGNGSPVLPGPVERRTARKPCGPAGSMSRASTTGSNPIAVACAGFVRFAMMAAEDGSFGYEMEIITYPGLPTGIEEASDINPAATLAFHVRDLQLGLSRRLRPFSKSEFGMEPETQTTTPASHRPRPMNNIESWRPPTRTNRRGASHRKTPTHLRVQGTA